ncbi:MAG: ABC transporter ATP-binding protein [Pseudomonadota bacterium]
MSAALDISHLEKHFPTKTGLLHAVDGVTLSIAAGESVGLVGESGCGKSTLARVVARLIDSTSGRITCAGADIGAIPARRFGTTAHRARIQVVFQDPTDSLNPHLRAQDSILDPLKRLRGDLSREARRRRVREVAAQCGLPEALLDRYPHQLSGGQKARVGIARALAVEPQILILDEPTSALDVSVQAVILHLLAELRARLGISYLFVSHDLNVVRLVCDRVAVMYLGKIVELAPTEALFTAPQHPYTAALLDAIPGKARRHPRLEGEPSSPIAPDPNVCRFAGRCPRGSELCRSAAPNLAPHAPGHRVACHHPLGTSATMVAP